MKNDDEIEPRRGSPIEMANATKDDFERSEQS